MAQFNKIPNKVTSPNKSVKDKQANISRIPLSISPKPSKNILAKSKFYKKNQILTLNFQLNKYLYTQASKSNVKDIVKIKNIFPKLSANKVSEIHKVINNSSQKDKPRLNITTKDLLRKNIIISMRLINASRVMSKATIYISNINKLFKRVKSEISVNFI